MRSGERERRTRTASARARARVYRYGRPRKIAHDRRRRARAVHGERLIAFVVAAAKHAVRLIERARSGLLERVLEREHARLVQRGQRRSVSREHRLRRERRRRRGRRRRENARRRGEQHAASSPSRRSTRPAAGSRGTSAQRDRASRASAASAPAGSLPPPCACAGAPPPLPPTSGAAALTRLPACTPAFTASSLALTNSDALLAVGPDERDDARAQPRANRVAERAQRLGVRLANDRAPTTRTPPIVLGRARRRARHRPPRAAP